MELPQRLIDFAKLAPTPARWDDSALILIDHQREYTDGRLALPGATAATAEMVRLLAAARRHGAPVVHVFHHGRPGAPLFDPNQDMAAPIGGLEPGPGEHRVIKHLPNAFAGTGLHALLGHLGRRQLVIAGFATHMCISATTRAALDLGYASTVVANACATRDLPGHAGGVVSADMIHRATLAALADRFACVVADTNALV